MTHTFEKTEASGQKLIGYAPYIDANKPTPVVKGTNVTATFFDNAGIDAASVHDAGIAVYQGYNHGEDVKISVNGKQVDDVSTALIAAGDKPLALQPA